MHKASLAISRSSKQDETTTNMLFVQTFDGVLYIVGAGHECKAISSHSAFLHLDDDVFILDGDVSSFEELDNFFRLDPPWKTSHLDCSVTVAVVERISQAQIFEYGPNRARVG